MEGTEWRPRLHEKSRAKPAPDLRQEGCAPAAKARVACGLPSEMTPIVSVCGTFPRGSVPIRDNAVGRWYQGLSPKGADMRHERALLSAVGAPVAQVVVPGRFTIQREICPRVGLWSAGSDGFPGPCSRALLCRSRPIWPSRSLGIVWCG